MHLLVAAHDCYPDPGSGGTGRYVYETGRRLVERGHRVSVVTRRRGDCLPRETVAGMDVHRYDLEVAGRNAFAIAAQVPDALRRVGDAVADATTTDPIDHASFQGPTTSLLVHHHLPDAVPRTVIFHSPWPTEYRIRSDRENRLSGARTALNAEIRAAIEAHMLRAANRVVTLSEFMRDELRAVYEPSAFGLQMDRVPDATVVPGGVDTERFRPDADPLPGIGGDPAFLTVRRLSPRMGHDLLLDAFAAVSADHPGARLHVAGDGPLREELERRAADRGVESRTKFHGYVPDADLPGAYAAADCFVLPTTELEGFGLATLEALASGTPVVATSVGGTPEVLDGLDDAPGLPARLLADAATPDALAERMASWADARASARLAAGRACRTHACRHFQWDRTVEALGRLYDAEPARDGRR